MKTSLCWWDRAKANGHLNVKCRPGVQIYLQHSVGVTNMIVRKNLTKKSEKGGWIKQFSSSRSAPVGQKISLIHEEKYVLQKYSKIFEPSRPRYWAQHIFISKRETCQNWPSSCLQWRQQSVGWEHRFHFHLLHHLHLLLFLLHLLLQFLLTFLLVESPALLGSAEQNLIKF